MKKQLIAFAASLAVNFALLGAMDWSAHDAQTAPAGEVTVTQLSYAVDLQVHAQMSPSGSRNVAAAL